MFHQSSPAIDEFPFVIEIEIELLKGMGIWAENPTLSELLLLAPIILLMNDD